MKYFILVCVICVFIFSLLLFLYPVIDRNIYERKKKLYELTKNMNIGEGYYRFMRVTTVILLISSLLVLVIFILVG